MLNKYKSTTRLEKVFIWLSAAIVVAALGLYIREVAMALAMDPASYNCTSDSMMKQICQDPFGTSIFWSLFLLVIVGWPVLIAWTVIGAVLIGRHWSR